jgi:hypothetical protein
VGEWRHHRYALMFVIPAGVLVLGAAATFDWSIGVFIATPILLALLWRDLYGDSVKRDANSDD